MLRSDTAALRAMLQARHFEVQCTLRPSLDDPAALAAARAAVLDALALDEELTDLAAAHEMSKGRLFQELLEELRAAGVDHAQTDNSARRDGTTDHSIEFGAARWRVLAARADALRRLVRIKVARAHQRARARARIAHRGLREPFLASRSLRRWRTTTTSRRRARGSCCAGSSSTASLSSPRSAAATRTNTRCCTATWASRRERHDSRQASRNDGMCVGKPSGPLRPPAAAAGRMTMRHERASA